MVLKENAASEQVKHQAIFTQYDACGNNITAVLMPDRYFIAYAKALLADIHSLFTWKHYLLSVKLIVSP